MLIETKLQIPLPKANSILRLGLLDTLKRSLDRRLVAVVAGAGAGKTTLLAQAVAQFRLPAVYVSLDASDAGLAVFIEYLTAGLTRQLASEGRSSLDRALADELAALRESARRDADPDAAAGRLVNILARHRAQELYLVLDDYHVIPAESPVHTFLDLFIDRMPAIMHLVIASRTAIPLPGIPRWLSKQEMTELTASDLALKPDDARSLISACYGASLAPAEFQYLMDRTEGWMTGVHLIMQAAGMHKSVKETLNGYIAANKPLFDYFASEILARETEGNRGFLQAVSVLDEIDAAMCDRLVGRKGSSVTLADLERRNIFITKKSAFQYQFHPLFKSFLQDSIADRTRTDELHRRAAGIYAAAGNELAAIEHAITGQDHQRAARLLVKMDMVSSEITSDVSYYSRLGRWFQALPDAVYKDHPLLFLTKASCLKEKGDAAGELAAIETAVALLRKSGNRLGLARALCHLADRRSQSDMAAAVRTMRTAVRLCPASNRPWRAALLNSMAGLYVRQGKYDLADANFTKVIRLWRNKPSDLIWVRNNQAALQMYRGENLRAMEMYRDLAAGLSENSLEPEAIMFFYNAFNAAIESGHIDQAVEFIEQGRRFCRPYWDAFSRLLMDHVEPMLDFYQGRLNNAEAKIIAIRDRYLQLQYRNRAVGVEMRLVRLHRLAGRLDAADSLLEDCARRSRMFERRPAAIEELRPWFQKGMLDAARGRIGLARREAATIAAVSRRLSHHTGIYVSHMILAKISRSEADRRRHFRLALECSHRHGYHGTLAMELRADPALRALLKDLPASSFSISLIRHLLQHPSAEEAAVPTGTIRVRLLGQLELSDHSGKRIDVKWRTRKVQALFAYLVLHRERACHREELIDALWPNDPLDRAKKSLYYAAFTLKRNLVDGFRSAGLENDAFKEPIQQSSQSYRLSPDIVFYLDVEELEQTRNAAVDLPDGDGKADTLRASLSLYRDAFLPSLSEQWCEQQREQYHSMFMFISEKLGALLHKSGNPEQALLIYQRLLHDEPLADRVRIQHWRVLKQIGREADIRSDYKKYVRLLKRTYREQPSDELQAAYAALS